MHLRTVVCILRMWIVLGTKEKTERVPGGRQFESRCQSCGEIAMFYERRLVSTFRLYFLDVVDYRQRIVMACGACGTLFATGDAVEPDMLTKATDAAGQVGSAIATGAQRAVARIAGAARDVLRPGPSRPILPKTDPAYDDTLREDEGTLEARFRELEARVRIDTSAK